jgi:hypothetical protein
MHFKSPFLTRANRVYLTFALFLHECVFPHRQDFIKLDAKIRVSKMRSSLNSFLAISKIILPEIQLYQYSVKNVEFILYTKNLLGLLQSPKLSSWPPSTTEPHVSDYVEQHSVARSSSKPHSGLHGRCR